VPFPRVLTTDQDPCKVADEWGLDDALSQAIWSLATIWVFIEVPWLRWPIRIISGLRTVQHQLDLDNPLAAPWQLSTHTSCPATGVDLDMPGASDDDWLALGRLWERKGGRWGGGAPRDARGLPIGAERHHFDLGPRMDQIAMDYRSTQVRRG